MYSGKEDDEIVKTFGTLPWNKEISSN